MQQELGYITKPQGVRGEFRVRPNILDGNVLKNIKEVVIKNQAYNVLKVTLREGFIIMLVEGIDDRNFVETLRNIPVYYQMEEDTLQEGEYYIKDLIGSKVFSSTRNVELGVLVDINKYGAADVYTVKTDKDEFMFPFARNVITKIDTENKIIYLDELVLNEIKC